MALQVLDENQIVRTIPEVSEVGARIDEKVQANMPEDGADGKDGLSIWETTTNTTTGTTSIAISTLNKVAGRSVQVGDYIIGNATYSYLYLVTAVNSTTVTVTYRRTLRGATGSGGSVTVDTALSETSENPVQNKVINAALKDGTVTKIGNVLKVGGETYNGSAAVNAGRRSWYGVCPTTGNQPAKEVNDIPDFVLETGAKVSVRFTYENSASAPTLNVNGTGAKSIRNSNSAAGTLTYRWYPYQVVDFVYDGTYWLLQQPYVGTTTYYGTSKVASLTLNGSSNATPSFYAPTVDTGGRWLRGTGLGEPEWSLPINIQDSYTEISSDKTLPDLGVGHTGVICYFTSHSSPYTIYLPSSGEWAFAYQVSNSYYDGAVEEFSCAKSVAWHNSSGGSAIRVIKGNGKYTSIMIIYTRTK